MQQHGYDKHAESKHKLVGITGSRGDGLENGVQYKIMTTKQKIQEKIQIIGNMGNRNYIIDLGVCA
jgi:hypothetical protein